MRPQRTIPPEPRPLARLPALARRWRLFLRSLPAIRDAERLAALDLPWWCFAATERVERFLAERGGAAAAFEYGPGASTLWLARRCRSVRYVEHDPGWAARLQDLLAGVRNAEGTIVPARPAAGGPDARSRRLGWHGLDFSGYVAAIRDAGGPFDLIVIDGRARAACLRTATAHLKEDGLILLDNAGRLAYRTAIRDSGLALRRFVGLTPAAPYPTQTALLARSRALLRRLG